MTRSFVRTADATVSLTELTQTPDPEPLYRSLRSEYGSVAPVVLEPGINAWLVMGVQELRSVTERQKLFSRDARNWRDLTAGTVPPDSGLLPMMGYRDTVVGKDLAEHQRLRRPLDDAVRGIAPRLLRRQVRERCDLLIDAFSGRGSADLVTEYAVHAPMQAFSVLFGLDVEQGHELNGALLALFGSQPDSQAGNRDFEQILREHLRDREKMPKTDRPDDLTSAFLAHPGLHSEDEQLQAMVMMIAGGNEPVTCWIAHTLLRVITDPSFGARLRGGDLGVNEALDQVLWAEPPMTNMPARYALRDTDLGGHRIRRGDALILGFHATHATDPTLPPDPRPAGNRGHFAYSAGAHMCPAQDPAWTITHTAVTTALHRLAAVRLSISRDEVTFNPSPWTRRPSNLPVTFTVPMARTPKSEHEEGDEKPMADAEMG
ncbi:cytochrome P450 [Streptomyces xiaopingdaonensis]|uniref:cytochrome P450 n=1 Tax=Streptomyces xiaopingdaonensis TaxID=1565415 RepID=UPI0002F5C345|nr:cytochrome P450 [Streptomyces xiaopingdaonensis]